MPEREQERMARIRRLVAEGEFYVPTKDVAWLLERLDRAEADFIERVRSMPRGYRPADVADELEHADFRAGEGAAHQPAMNYCLTCEQDHPMGTT